MKKLITAIAIGVFTFAGTAVQSEARPHGGYGYNTPSSSVYVSGYRHGRPVYTQKYFVGYDRCGTPRYSYRTVSAPSRGYSQHGSSNSRYSRSYGNRGNSRYTSRSYDSRRSSGSRVSFSYCR